MSYSKLESAKKNKAKPSYIRNILQAATETGVISLAGGLPAESSFPLQKLHESASRLLEDPGAMQYSITEGEPELRQWIANRLGAELDQILITNGAQQAMDLVARALINTGDEVVVEVPAYLGALQVFELAGARIVPVNQTLDGPDLEQLESAFRRRPKLFYAVPDFHNPSGCCWPVCVRNEVITLAKKYQVMIVEDAPYRELCYSGMAQPTLYKLAPEQVCHLGSFSKVVAPALRLGFLCAGESIIALTTVIKQASDLHSSTLCQRLLLACLQEPFYCQHIDRLCENYRQRRDMLADTLMVMLGDTVVRFKKPEGGMFLWVTVIGCDTNQLAEQAIIRKVAIVPGSVFYLKSRQQGCDKIRLSFTHVEPSVMAKGVERLAETLKVLQA